MRTGWALLVLGLGLFCLAGCQSPESRDSHRSPAGMRIVSEDLTLGPEQAAMAEALAYFSLGILREGLASGSAVDSYRRALEWKPDYDPLYLRAAVLYIKEGQTDKAIALMQDACRRNPRSAEAWLYLTQIYQALNQPAEAIKTAQRAIRIEPANSRGYIQLAYLYLAAHDEARALATLEEALGKAADKLPVLRFMGDLYAQKIVDSQIIPSPHAAKAITCYEQAAAFPPDDASLQYQERLGDLYLLSRQPDKALALFRNLTIRLPDSIQLQKKLAVCYMQAEPAKAGQILRSGLKQFPEDKNLLEMLIPFYLQNQQPLEALDSFVRLQNLLLRDNARLPDARFYLDFGTIAQQHKFYDKAVALYEKGLEQDPGLLEACIRLAFLHLSRHNLDEALNVMDEAVLSHPEDPVAWHYFGLLYSRAEIYPPAIRAFERVETLAARLPNTGLLLDTTFYFNYGAACERSGQFERAEALLQRAIRLDTENAEAFNYLAYLWAEKGIHLDQALEYSRQALDCEPDNGAFLDTLGWILYKQGKVAEALTCLQAACYFMPDDPTILEHLGDVWSALRDDSQALACWKQSYRINAGNKTLAEKLRKHGLDVKTGR